MPTQVNVKVVVVDAGGNSVEKAERIGNAIANAFADVFGEAGEVVAAPVSQAAGVRDMVRVIRMIREYGFITDEIDFSVIGELIEEIQDLIVAFNAIDTSKPETVTAFLDLILAVIDIMARSTSWTIDDKIVEVAKLVAGPGEIRDWAIGMICRLIDNKMKSEPQDTKALFAANDSSATGWSDWFGFARMVLSIIGALR